MRQLGKEQEISAKPTNTNNGASSSAASTTPVVAAAVAPAPIAGTGAAATASTAAAASSPNNDYSSTPMGMAAGIRNTVPNPAAGSAASASSSASATQPNPLLNVNLQQPHIQISFEPIPPVNPLQALVGSLDIPSFNKQPAHLNSAEQALLTAALKGTSPQDLLIQKLFGSSLELSAQLEKAHTHDIQAINHALTKEREKVQKAQALMQQPKVGELAELRNHKKMAEAVFKQIKELLKCGICTEVSVLPKVLGKCGHVACTSCLEQLDTVTFATLASSGVQASARQHLLARRCPTCREEIIGSAFNVQPLREIAQSLVADEWITVDNKYTKRVAIEHQNYPPETAEQGHISALQMGCYVQSKLAQHAVKRLIGKKIVKDPVTNLDVVTNDDEITQAQWKHGVYISFESAVSRVFFETFATNLHGKAGGVNVLVNSAQRMLAAQIVTKKKADPNATEAPAATAAPVATAAPAAAAAAPVATAAPAAATAAAATKEKEPYLLVKVATDGRYTITTAPSTAEIAAKAALDNAAAALAKATAAHTSAAAVRDQAIAAQTSAAAIEAKAIAAQTSAAAVEAKATAAQTRAANVRAQAVTAQINATSAWGKAIAAQTNSKAARDKALAGYGTAKTASTGVTAAPSGSATASAVRTNATATAPNAPTAPSAAGLVRIFAPAPRSVSTIPGDRGAFVNASTKTPK